MVSITCAGDGIHRCSGRKRPGTRARCLHTRAGCHRPDGRRLSTVTCAPPTASILRHSTIRRRRTSAQHCGCSARVRWAKARISSSKHSLITGNLRSRPHRRPIRTGLARSDGSAGHPADNYYNPFGVDLPIDLRRRLVEAGNRTTEQEVDLWRALIGLEGSVARWTWELALQSAKSEATSCRERLPRASALGSRPGSIRAG